MSLRNSASPQPMCAKITSGLKPWRLSWIAPAATRLPRWIALRIDALKESGVSSVGQVVAEKRYPRQTRLAQQVGLFPNPDDSKTRFPRVMGRQVAVLAREILMNKQQAHQTGSRIARLR